MPSLVNHQYRLNRFERNTGQVTKEVCFIERTARQRGGLAGKLFQSSRHPGLYCLPANKSNSNLQLSARKMSKKLPFLDRYIFIYIASRARLSRAAVADADNCVKRYMAVFMYSLARGSIPQHPGLGVLVIGWASRRRANECTGTDILHHHYR